MRFAREMSAVLVLVAMPIAAHGGDAEISDARKEDSGFLVHTVKSPFQAGQTEVRLLLPNRLEEGERYPARGLPPSTTGWSFADERRT